MPPINAVANQVFYPSELQNAVIPVALPLCDGARRLLFAKYHPFLRPKEFVRDRNIHHRFHYLFCGC